MGQDSGRTLPHISSYGLDILLDTNHCCSCFHDSLANFMGCDNTEDCYADSIHKLDIWPKCCIDDTVLYTKEL